MKKLFPILAFLFLFNNAYSVVITVPAGAGPYPTLAAAFAAINAGAPYNGAVTVTITANEVLGGPATLGAATATFTSLLLRPSGAITISGGAGGVADALIILNNADNVTIDGLNTGGNSLTIDNVSPALTAGSILMQNGSSFNIVRNCRCSGVGVSTTTGGRIINIGQSTTAVGNDNNTIENNIIVGGRRGIQTFGTAGLVTNNGTIIRNNIVKNSSSLAIFIGSETRDNSVIGNEVFMDAPVSVGAAVNFRGINCQGASTNLISKNRVHDLTSTDPSSTYFGILVIPVTPTAPGPVGNAIVNVINNCVTLMTSDGSPQTVGIDISNIDLKYTANVYFNTFRLAGVSSASSVFTASLLVDNSQAGSVVNVANNIAINGRTGGVDSLSQHTGYDITAFPQDSVALNSDYNMAASTTTSAWAAGYDGILYSNPIIDVYKDSTCGDNIEQHTMFRNVNFVGANDCHLGPVGGDMCGRSIAGVTDDIDGNPRNPTFPYKGCDEKVTPLRILDLGGCLESKVNNGQVKVVLRTPGCVKIDSCTADLIESTDNSRLCFGDAVGAGPFYLDVITLNHVETYSAAPVAFVGATFTYNFKPARSTAFGSNLTAAGPPHCFYAGDQNQNGTVDLTDIVNVFNDASTFLVGCRLRSDMNSDGLVDLGDIIVTFNNSSSFVAAVKPCPEPNFIYGPVENTNVRRLHDPIENSGTRAAINF